MAVHSQRRNSRSRRMARQVDYIRSLIERFRAREGHSKLARALASTGLVAGVLFMVVGPSALPASASTGLSDNFIDLTGSIQWDGTGHVGWANGLNQGTGANCSNGGVNLKGSNGLFNCGAAVSVFPPTASQQPVYNSALGSANGVFDHVFIQDQTNVDTTACPGGNQTGSNIFGGGQKFNDDPQNLTHSLGSADQKDEIGNVYAVARQSSPSAGGNDEVYVGLERLVNNGDTHADFQFLQGPVSMPVVCGGSFTGVHRQGDVTLEINFNTGGGNPQPAVLIWSCTSATGGGSGTPILSGTQDSTGTVCSANPKLPNGNPNPNFVATAGWAQEMECSNTQPEPCYQPGSVAIASNDTSTPGADTTTGSVGCGGWVCRSTKSPYTTTTVPSLEFMEGAISLDTLGLNAACGAYFFPLTRAAGSADSSQVKAFAPPRKFDTCTGTTTVTTPHDSTGAISTTNGVTLGASAHDVAVVTTNAGTAQSSNAPSGSVNFYVCGPLASAAGCSSADSTRHAVATAAPTAGTSGTPTSNATTFTSADFTPTTVGTYCFEADFNATGKFENSSDGSPTECFVVNPLTPGFTTSPTSSTITFGGSNTDTATVTGNSIGGTPGGTVQFYLCQVTSGSTCSGGSAVGSPVTLKAATLADTATATSNSVSPAPGTWCFNASYTATTGGNYASVAAETNGSAECFIVNKQGSKTATTASGTATFGQGTLSDSVQVSPTSGTGPAPTGTVQFYVCETTSTFCPTTSTPDGQPVPLIVPQTGSTSTASAPDFPPTSPGTWCFSAVYSGDGNYLGSQDNTNADNAAARECVTVGKATTKTTTVVFDASSNQAWTGTETVGASAYDTGSVVPDPAFNNAPTPTGTFSYVFFHGSGCSTTPIAAGSSSLTGDSSTEGPLAAGSYSFQATYSGDSNYSGSTGACENFMVNKGPVTVDTTVFDASTNHAWSGSETTGASAYDTSTVTGSSSAFPPSGGNVSYKYFTAADCSGTGTAAGGGVLGPNDNSTTEGPLAAGSYSFQATYSGDSNYDSKTGPCENFTVNKGTSSVSTTVFDASTNAAWTGAEATGASAYDTSSVTASSEAFAPTGMVSYTFFRNGTCAIDTGSSAGGPLALGTRSSTEGPLGAGSYSFQATYTGDVNYTGNTGPCEPFAVNKGTSSTATTVFDAATNAAWTGHEVGSPSAYDTSTVTASSNAIAPTGTISYTFFTNGTCAAHTGTDAGTNLALGSHSNTEGPLSQGVYSFQATYSGDANYAGSTGDCEPFTVSFPVITAAKSSSPADGSVVHPGDTVTYTITLSNGGLMDATGVTLTDAVPAGTTYVANSASDGGVLSGTTINWSGLTVPGGGTKAVTFQVTVNANDTDGQVIPNHAIFPNINTPQSSCIQSSDTTVHVTAVQTTSPLCDTNTVTLTVAIPIINVVKSEPTPGNGQTVTAGQTAPITYKLAVTNAGSAAAINLVVTDVIPTGATYVAGSATPSADASYNSSTKTITWTIPTIAAKSGSTPGEVDLTFQVSVNASDANGSTITNQASFTNLNTPNCTAGPTTAVCLTNTVSNPVVTPPPIQVTPAPQVAPTTTTTVAHHALAFTGLNARTLAILAVALVGGGTILVLFGRRRRPNRN